MVRDSFAHTQGKSPNPRGGANLIKPDRSPDWAGPCHMRTHTRCCMKSQKFASSNRGLRSSCPSMYNHCMCPVNCFMGVTLGQTKLLNMTWEPVRTQCTGLVSVCFFKQTGEVPWDIKIYPLPIWYMELIPILVWGIRSSGEHRKRMRKS